MLSVKSKVSDYKPGSDSIRRRHLVKLPPKPKRELRQMTVCVVALSSGGGCMSCVADKALTYAELCS